MELEFHQLDLRYERLRVRRSDVERRLLGSLSEVGQQVPIAVVAASEPGRYVVIDGFRRIRALRRLGRDTVLAMLWPVSEWEALLVDRASRLSSTLSALEQVLPLT
jgi:ParB-like chromosome segregation protein Spo0J